MSKSNKKRRLELQAQKQHNKGLHAAEQATRRAAKQSQFLQRLGESGILVDSTKLAPDTSYDQPDFVKRGYYEDMPFTCQKCGKEEIWTATQQKWWYEVAKGGVWTKARLCRPCRRDHRQRRDETRRIHLEGLTRKANRDTGVT